MRTSLLLCVSGLLFCLVAACRGTSSGSADIRDFTLAQLAFSRKSTLRLLEEIEKTGRPDEVLRFRAHPKAAPLGWQLMHLAATEDRMANQAFARRPLISTAWTEQFRSGKPAGPQVPPFAEVKRYLTESRAALEKSIREFPLSRLDTKPTPDARFDFRTSLHVLAYHEPHHQGQAHATFNIFRARRR